MRVFLTKPELETEAGKQLLELSVQIATDGRIDLEEIKELRRWLRANNANDAVAAIAYLSDIMNRITADKVIDRDELLELHLAIERVIPPTNRSAVTQARSKQAAERRVRRQELHRIEKEKQKAERKREREEEYIRYRRLRHSFAKVAGVTFANDDGSERQDVIEQCKLHETLILRHDAYNEHSTVATQVLRTNGDQLGHAPEYLAEQIVSEIEDGYQVVGILKNLTGGTNDRPVRGVNFAAFFVAKDVTKTEFLQYARSVLADQG